MPKSTFAPGTLAYEALAYASRGIRIFPLWHVDAGVCQCSRGTACDRPGKHPRNRHGLDEATSDEAQVDRWWAMWPDANVGMPAGGNGYAIIDVDPYHGGEHSLETLCDWALRRGVDLMATHTVRTGSGGLHLYYAAPAGGIKSTAKAFGAKGIGLDTRGRGGYVVAPPSQHASGGRYEVIADGHGLAPWPHILTPLMQPQTPARPAAGPALPAGASSAQRWFLAALDRERDALAALPATEGNGKTGALNRAAYKIGQRLAAGGVDEVTAVETLLSAATHWQGHGAAELERIIRGGMRAGARDPRAPLAARERA